MTRRLGHYAGAMLRARVCLAVMILPAAAPVGGDREVTVALDHTQGACRVRGAFHASVSTAVAWSVLTDYEHIDRFVSSVRSSRLERASDGRLLLRQDAVGDAFLLHRRVQVLLDIHEDPDRRITFRDVLGRDFRDYAGEWRIAADSAGTHVEYELGAEPRGLMARAFCRGALRNTARHLLEQVRAEMLRRGGQSRG